ncbi:hypothetical protein GDO86_004303 [Hymenochirus boettgeri]|uniref:J domain-containing protein n=1 Tax=Hymenochirus boettgeri TaxID=247094 RepID=A0A8T2K7T1_9PIPI|nr:hypothetical protein GDO86_004303 [Hymenochirus boettgeri]KAG8452463.1 hypothetical protein GDO86_004303 [Hymenochirus boettgeri]
MDARTWSSRWKRKNESASHDICGNNDLDFSMLKNLGNPSADHGLKTSLEQNGSGTSHLDLGETYQKQGFNNSKGNEKLTSNHFIKEGFQGDKVFFSQEHIAGCFGESSDTHSVSKEPDCNEFKSRDSFSTSCGCVRENVGSDADNYLDIVDHTLERGCHHFSSYQQRVLNREGDEDEDCAKQMEGEEDSYKGSFEKKGNRRVKKRTNQRSDGRQTLYVGGKHKVGRKKSHTERKYGLQTMVLQPLMWLSTSFIQILLYIWLWLPARDFDLLKIQLRTFGCWLQQRTKDFWNLTCSCGLWLLYLLKMASALLFLVLMLFVGSVRLCWQYIKKSMEKTTVNRYRTSGFSERLHKIWDLVIRNRTFRQLINTIRQWATRIWPFKLKIAKEPSWASAGSPSMSKFQPGEEVERLLSMANMPEEQVDPFQVLGVEINASDTELKKAYRQLAVLVHPDKNNHPRAEEAFKVLRAAWDTVSNPEKRKDYEMKRMSETELAKSMNDFLIKLQDDLKDAMNSMMCSKCQGKHRRFEMERDPANARYCAECGKMHPAEEGDFWAESSMLGLKITYFALMQGKVFDITEWAGCQRVGISPDTHRVPYHISFGNRNHTGRQRAPSEGTPTSVADLQNLLNRIFQGAPGPMPNGNLFNSPQNPSHGTRSPSGPSKSETAPRSDVKPKKKKKLRRPQR